MNTITVVGIGADGWDGLAPSARAAIADAEVLFGSARQLSSLPDTRATRVSWPSPLIPVLPELLARHEGSRLCVLASGDPMFHGIGVTLANLLGAQRLRVLPQPSSAALACARLGWPVAQTPVVNAVGRPPAAVLADIWPGARLLVLSSGEHTPAALAAILTESGFGDAELIVMEQLGGPAERQYRGQAATWAAPAGDSLNIVAISCGDSGPRLTRNPGLPDSLFGGDGQLTKRNIRALTLAALAPAPGELLWDVGAGTGSIAIEWCRTNPACRAVTFERDAARAARIPATALALGVFQVEVAGAAPVALAAAPDPDAVFIGGGVTEPGVIDTCWQRLRNGGRLVVNAVTAESEALLLRWYGRYGGELDKFQAYQARPLGTYTALRPQLPVTRWSVTKP